MVDVMQRLPEDLLLRPRLAAVAALDGDLLERHRVVDVLDAAILLSLVVNVLHGLGRTGHTLPEVVIDSGRPAWLQLRWFYGVRARPACRGVERVVRPVIGTAPFGVQGRRRGRIVHHCLTVFVGPGAAADKPGRAQRIGWALLARLRPAQG